MLKTKSEKIITYLIVVWMIINIGLFVLMIVNGDEEDPNNWIEIGLWVISIVGLLASRKWGSLFAIFTLAYTLSTSVGLVIYNLDLTYASVLGVNAFRVIINAVIIVYLSLKMLKKMGSSFLPNC